MPTKQQPSDADLAKQEAALTLEEQIAAKEQELSALRQQMPGYETHPDVWDSQGRLVSNVLAQ